MLRCQGSSVIRRKIRPICGVFDSSAQALHGLSGEVVAFEMNDFLSLCAFDSLHS
jgi:hypothetical protein